MLRTQAENRCGKKERVRGDRAEVSTADVEEDGVTGLRHRTDPTRSREMGLRCVELCEEVPGSGRSRILEEGEVSQLKIRSNRRLHFPISRMKRGLNLRILSGQPSTSGEQ